MRMGFLDEEGGVTELETEFDTCVRAVLPIRVYTLVRMELHIGKGT